MMGAEKAAQEQEALRAGGVPNDSCQMCTFVVQYIKVRGAKCHRRGRSAGHIVCGRGYGQVCVRVS